MVDRQVVSLSLYLAIRCFGSISRDTLSSFILYGTISFDSLESTSITIMANLVEWVCVLYQTIRHAIECVCLRVKFTL